MAKRPLALSSLYLPRPGSVLTHVPTGRAWVVVAYEDPSRRSARGRSTSVHLKRASDYHVNRYVRISGLRRNYRWSRDAEQPIPVRHYA